MLKVRLHMLIHPYCDTRMYCSLMPELGLYQGRMNYPEKQEEIGKEEWLEKLQSLHITRADMNGLIMNYLVTGKRRVLYLYKLVIINVLFNVC